MGGHDVHGGLLKTGLRNTRRWLGEPEWPPSAGGKSQQERTRKARWSREQNCMGRRHDRISELRLSQTHGAGTPWGCRSDKSKGRKSEIHAHSITQRSQVCQLMGK